MSATHRNVKECYTRGHFCFVTSSHLEPSPARMTIFIHQLRYTGLAVYIADFFLLYKPSILELRRLRTYTARSCNCLPFLHSFHHSHSSTTNTDCTTAFSICPIRAVMLRFLFLIPRLTRSQFFVFLVRFEAACMCVCVVTFLYYVLVLFILFVNCVHTSNRYSGFLLEKND